jgi:hypothetical protein
MTPVDAIPAEARWSLAAKGLLGVYAAAGALGYENVPPSFNDFSRKVWADTGARARDFCQAFHLPCKNARDLHQVSMIYATSLLGPEFEFETVEESELLSVGRTSRCPFVARAKESGASNPRCRLGHQSWGESMTRVLNPDYSFTLLKTMPDGYPYCEWIVERIFRS